MPQPGATDLGTDVIHEATNLSKLREKMNPHDIREVVQSMWLTTPEAELLGCIALALAELLESVTAGNVAAPAADGNSGTGPRRCLAARGCR